MAEPMAKSFKILATEVLRKMAVSAKPETIPHLTIKFFHEIPAESNAMPAIINGIAKVAARHHPIHMEVDRMGYFTTGDNKFARTLFARCSSVPDELQALSDEIQLCESILGNEPGTQPFHITLLNKVRGLEVSEAERYVQTANPFCLPLEINTFSLYRCRHDSVRFFEEIARFELK